MCLLIVALRCHPNYPLVVFSGQDNYWHQFHGPPAKVQGLLYAPGNTVYRSIGACMKRITTGTRKGGTWFAIDPEKGSFAALLNITGPYMSSKQRPDRPVTHGRASTCRLRQPRRTGQEVVPRPKQRSAECIACTVHSCHARQVVHWKVFDNASRWKGSMWFGARSQSHHTINTSVTWL